ncbi:MAG: efflux RND transporter periplasmic adaptor subunit [Bacteroidales bacterium]|nr:efflux RND transporter periplasmic adaptor subunit [Bacteroidales bacterium]
MKKYIFLAIIFILQACSTKDKTQKQDNLLIKGDTIVLATNSYLISKIKIEKITSEPYSVEVSTFGIVQAIPTNYAEIAAPFAGRITKSFVRLGQHVAVDEPIFELSSRSFFEVGKLYYQAKQEMQLAEKNLKRQQDLFNNGVGIQKDLEEAEVNFELHKRDFENVTASLKVFKVDPEGLVLGQPLIVRSPIAGDIISNNIIIGQYLKEDANPVTIVAELSKVWIVGHVKEKDISNIHESEKIEITAHALPGQEIKGKIYHISDILDEKTRSAQVYIECDNANHALKPGMYVSVRFIEQPQDNILVPSSSVFQKEEKSFVFVSEGMNKYTTRSVEVRGTPGKKLLLTSGLKPGERIVTEGGYYLLDLN